jgi:hypothetical protein
MSGALMLRTFLRLAVYIPVEDADGQDANFTEASWFMESGSVRSILRILRNTGYAGTVGSYEAVAEISPGLETFVPTGSSQPAHGSAGAAAVVPSARLVTYLPSSTPAGELSRLADEIAAAHPWEHPVLEVDTVRLWMPA